MTNENEIKDIADFELPEMDSGNKASAPRITIGGSTCTSCEG